MAAPLLFPELLLKAARQLGIDEKDSSQTHLLGAAKAFLQLPLPAPFTRTVGPSSELNYLNTRTNQTTAEHPQRGQFLKLLQTLASHPPRSHEQRTCMVFEREDGSAYVHDFGPIVSLQHQQHGTEKSASEIADLPGTTPVESIKDPSQHVHAQERKQDGETEGKRADFDASLGNTTENAAAPEVTTAGAPDAGTDTSEKLPEQADSEAPQAAMTSDQRSKDVDQESIAADIRTIEQPSQEDEPRTDAGWDAMPPHERLIPSVPLALLESFGIVKESIAEQSTLAETGVRPGVHKLRYFSWWFEDIESADLTFRVNSQSVVGGGLRKRYATIELDLRTQVFTFFSTNDDQELRIPNVSVLTKAGTVAEIWDLHIGATVQVMGRTLTLQKADLETTLWNEQHSIRLKKLKSDLLVELQKYKPRAHSNALEFSRGDRVNIGGLNLRHTVEQINKLLTDLQQYRPSKVEKFRTMMNVKVK